MKDRWDGDVHIPAFSLSKKSSNPSFTVKEEKEKDVSSPNASVSVNRKDQASSSVSSSSPIDVVTNSPWKRKGKGKDESLTDVGRLETTSSSSSVLPPSSSRSGICTMSPMVPSLQKTNCPRLSRKKERSGTGRKLLNKAKRSAGRIKERRSVKRGTVESSNDEKPPEVDHSEGEGAKSEWKHLLCDVVEEGVQDVIRGVLDGEHQGDDDEESEADYRSPANSAIHQAFDGELETKAEVGEETRKDGIGMEVEERGMRRLDSKRRLQHGGYKLWDDGEYDKDGVDDDGRL